MTSVQYTQRVPLEQTVTFEREAIPWIDDVYRFALSLTRDETDADDVVQDTFLRAFRLAHVPAGERLSPLAIHDLPKRVSAIARAGAADGGARGGRSRSRVGDSLIHRVRDESADDMFVAARSRAGDRRARWRTFPSRSARR